ncbi:clavesin-2-like isoform X2 [Agrilus planipennis]|nr:clavesin-2-like isoform X2 [Agrilus planipennis]
MTTTSLIISSFPWKSTLNKDKTGKDEDYTDLRSNIDKIAEKDLRETKSTKEQSLIQLKEWIKKNKNIDNCLVDDAFLLRFLRVKKYSIPMAQQVLLKYLNLRKRFKSMFYDLDYLDPSVYEIISGG